MSLSHLCAMKPNTTPTDINIRLTNILNTNIHFLCTGHCDFRWFLQMFGTFLAQIAYAYNFQTPEKLNDFIDQGFFLTNSKILSKFY